MEDEPDAAEGGRQFRHAPVEEERRKREEQQQWRDERKDEGELKDPVEDDVRQRHTPEVDRHRGECADCRQKTRPHAACHEVERQECEAGIHEPSRPLQGEPLRLQEVPHTPEEGDEKPYDAKEEEGEFDFHATLA